MTLRLALPKIADLVSPISPDLVDQEKSRRAATVPGVDCDVGNFILEAEGV